MCGYPLITAHEPKHLEPKTTSLSALFSTLIWSLQGPYKEDVVGSGIFGPKDLKYLDPGRCLRYPPVSGCSAKEDVKAGSKLDRSAFCNHRSR